MFDLTPDRCDLTSGSFKRDGGKAFVYWKPTNIMTTSFESVVDAQFFSEYDKIRLVDVMDCSVYEFKNEMIENKGNGVYHIKALPVKDTPLILVLGDFLI